MAQRAAAQAIIHRTALGDFILREAVTYPNGGTSTFYVCESTALIVDDGICTLAPGEQAFDYSLITSKQNQYVMHYNRVYRFLREDLAQLDRYALDVEYQQADPQRHIADRANTAQAPPLEQRFEEHFANVYGADSVRYLQREYAVTDVDGHVRFVDYVVRTKHGLIGIEENGVRYHHPQLIGRERYRTQLAKQNSRQHAGIRLYRFSTED